MAKLCPCSLLAAAPWLRPFPNRTLCSHLNHYTFGRCAEEHSHQDPIGSLTTPLSGHRLGQSACIGKEILDPLLSVGSSQGRQPNRFRHL